MKRTDVFIACAIGLLSDVFWAPVFVRLGIPPLYIALIAVLVPVSFPILVYAATFVPRLRSLAEQFARFMIVGVLNTGVDFAIFNLLLYVFAVTRGPSIIAFKSASFIVALLNSYFWNRSWAFGARAAASGATGREFARFASVTLLGLLLNVGVTAFIINLGSPVAGISQLRWDNIAAGIATVLNLTWNFAGYRIVVFGAKESPDAHA